MRHRRMRGEPEVKVIALAATREQNHGTLMAWVSTLMAMAGLWGVARLAFH